MFKIFNIAKFYEQVKYEATKIIWPTKKELWTSTILVVSVIIIASIFFLVCDFFVHKLVQFLLNVGK